MNCDECQQRASEFLDEEIHPREIRMLFSHLGSCDECWTYYRRVERLHSMMNRPPTLDRVVVPRHPVTSATFLLGSYVAFVIGVLLTLLLFPAKEDTRHLAIDQWPPYYYQTLAGDSRTGPNGGPLSPWRSR